MCGIAGKLIVGDRGAVDPLVIGRMTRALAHRGPDDEGVWADGAVGLGSRRLAVIDLSPRGHQPMVDESGALRIVFNGEIYNFQELRARLEAEGHRFRSGTDTEVVLHLYQRYGASSVRYLRGMFAFAIWDGRDRALLLARDRLGKKPLFYAQSPRGITFASEARALLADPDVRIEPAADAIDQYLSLGYVPAPGSAFAGMAKVPPAHWLRATEDGGLRLEQYWSLSYEPKIEKLEADARDELRALLEEAVRLRLIADVPVGALLSGGVDSSAVVALMRRVTNGPVRTFSIGFDRVEYSELAHARTVARHCGTEHHELVVRPEPEGLLDAIVHHYGEPFADSSAIPSLALCRMARSEVTVALSGDGGDESFLGYDRYRAMRAARRQDALPLPLRRAVAAAVGWLPSGETKSFGARVRRFADGLPLDPIERYARWTGILPEARKRSLYTPEFAARIAPAGASAIWRSAFDAVDAGSIAERAAAADARVYLPDDLLVKMDIASMAHSLEVRSPLLDHHVVEFAARLPVGMKLRGGVPKYLLKEAVKDLLPAAVLERSKMGFGVPIDHWLRRELKGLAYDVLLDPRAAARGYFRGPAVRSMLDQHMSGRENHQAALWALLVLEMWHRRFVDPPRSMRVEEAPASRVASG